MKYIWQLSCKIVNFARSLIQDITIDNMNDDIHHIFESKNIKATPNRVLVLKEIIKATNPVSLAEIDERISTMYKSTIFRVLNQFVEHDVVHTIDDGTGSLKYELCHGESNCSIEDMHVHFYCERCHRTICIEDTPIPQINLPQGFIQHSGNFVIKGVCAFCNQK